MLPSELDPYASYSQETRLRRLHRLLTLGGSSFALGGLAFVLPFGLIFALLRWAAIAFTPYMLWQLLRAGRYGWVIGFAVTVGLPALLGLFSEPDGVAGYLLGVLPLVTFFVYTWVLRHNVAEWLEELHWKREDAVKAALPTPGSKAIDRTLPEHTTPRT
jgi:hypothetical protein